MDNKKLIPCLGLAFLLSTPAVADLYMTKEIPASQDNTLIENADGARSDGTGRYFRVGLTGGNLGGEMQQVGSR